MAHLNFKRIHYPPLNERENDMTARIFIALFTLLALFACSEDKSVNPGPAPEVGAGKTLAEASFADQDLARVLRWALKKPRGATITTDELATLTRLRADEQGITNLAGIQHCINLDTLLLWGNDITDIQPLADLTKLERLDLGANEIADARPLEGLVNLIHLSLWGNQVTDIQPLTKLTKLEKLSLWGNGITDVQPLAKLTRLTQLQLGENEITDVSALDGLTRLNWLGLVGNPISDSALRQQIPTLMQEGVLISVRYPGPSSPVTVEDEPEPDPTPEPTPEQSDDRAVLLAFYAATGGGSAWTGDNWGSDEPIGTWQGVTTDDEGRVTELELFGLGLSGSIPTELGQLTNLQTLYLGQNQLSGSIPTELAQLTNLRYLDLFGNQLSGSIPTELAQLINLQSLYLFNNQLSGSIPTELAQLTNLQELYLNGNNFSGCIPASLRAIRGDLDQLGLSLCDESALPEHPADRAVLLVFYEATGGGSAWTGHNWDSDAPIGTWQGVTTDDEGRVIRLVLSDELAELDIIGSIPAELGQLTNLQELILVGYQLIGTIPAALGQLTNLQSLWLNGNQLTGTIPAELGQLTNLQELILGGNNLSGCVPAGLRMIPGDISRLGLSFCDESGQPPSGHPADRAVLLAFYNSTGGGSAWTGDNWGSDEPIDTWEGVTIDGEGRVTELNLSGLGLSGAIPSELGQLTNLTKLGLHGNQLAGSIPPELGQLTNLTGLFLGNNQLAGSIPSELGQLTNLTGLFLQNNQLAGSIPPELGQLTNLTGLSLDGNQLTGSIPSELGQLNNLRWLALQNNQLSGSIPPGLANLDLLFIAGNNLSGCIPASLQEIQTNDLDQLELSVCDG